MPDKRQKSVSREAYSNNVSLSIHTPSIFNKLIILSTFISIQHKTGNSSLYKIKNGKFLLFIEYSKMYKPPILIPFHPFRMIQEEDFIKDPSKNKKAADAAAPGQRQTSKPGSREAMFRLDTVQRPSRSVENSPS